MVDEKIKVSIGLFAHNEESNILATLKNLVAQDIFTSHLTEKFETTVSVLANGCTDKTAEVAQDFASFNELAPIEVIEIEKPGKSNAWNKFIHDSKQASCEYFICMDADIAFGSTNVMSTLIEALANSKDAYLSVDIAQKDTMLKVRKSIFERLSLLFSRLMKQGSTAVAGSLYCAHGERLRKITMPEGLPVEDGFLRAMLVTELFTQKDNNQRILVVDEVCHYFTPDSTLRSLFRHEERLLIGTFINSIIYGYLWKEVSNRETDAGSLISKNNKENPDWVEILITQYRESNDVLIPRHFYNKYWKQWNKLSLWKRVLTFPLFGMASIIKYFILKKISRKLKNETGLGYW